MPPESVKAMSSVFNAVVGRVQLLLWMMSKGFVRVVSDVPPQVSLVNDSCMSCEVASRVEARHAV